MEVFLVGKPQNRMEKIRDLLIEQSVQVEQVSLHDLPNKNGIYILFSSEPSKKFLSALSRLINGGSLVIQLGIMNSVMVEIPQILVIPDSIDDHSLVSLVELLFTLREKEKHYDWITV